MVVKKCFSAMPTPDFSSSKRASSQQNIWIRSPGGEILTGSLSQGLLWWHIAQFLRFAHILPYTYSGLYTRVLTSHDLFLLLSLTVRGARPGKNVQLTETEIRGLCLKSREIFLSQPILLELEAPLKICGKFCTKKYYFGDWLKIRTAKIIFMRPSKHENKGQNEQICEKKTTRGENVLKSRECYQIKN